MSYKLSDSELISKQSERVLSFITMQTIKNGSVSSADILKEFNLPTELMAQIRTYLLATGKVVEVP